MARKPLIQTAVSLMDTFWPDFKEIDDMVFLSSVQVTNPSSWLGDQWDHVAIEEHVNHTHMIDLFSHHAGRTPTPENDLYYDFEHPDFDLLCLVGKRIARLWYLKLKQDFPQYRFRVYYTQYDNPIVRFHRVREGEPNYMDEKDREEDIKKEWVIIYDTGEMID